MESLEAWLGPELDVRGLPRRPARHAHRRRLGAGLLSVWLAGAVGMVAAVTWLRPADPCAEVEDLAAAADAPSAETPAPIVGSALLHTLLVGVGEEFTQVFEGLQDLEGHAASQHNPDARTLAQAHGFQQQATRQWSDPQGNAALSHIVVQLDSPADAAAFNVEIARYSCTFADEVWSVPANSRVSAPVIGQRLRYGDGSVAEQLSWAQDGRRHLIVHYHRGGQPDRDLVVRLQAQAMLRG